MIEEQLAFQNKVIALLSEARKLQVDLEQQLETSESSMTSGTANSSEGIKAILKKLKNEEGAYPQQMLVAQISYLLNMVSGADQLPGNEAEERYTELLAQFNQLKEELMQS